MEVRGYNGNPLLKKPRQSHNWSPEQVKEWVKCANDPIYFAQTYIKIVHVDRGLIPIDLYDYQEEIINKITNNRRVTVVTSRQAGKCVEASTVINIRNKLTNKIQRMSVGEFYEIQKAHSENDTEDKK